MKKIPVHIWLLLAITVLGLFLRTYQINDWLRFGPDQARDAAIVGNVIENGESLPMLGPQSGNTLFYMGPAYYWFGYFSVSIFGINPPAFAYPIIFFSVLSIPLLYFFLRQFFSEKITLALVLFYAISYFSVVNSRYASNVNLIPFFLILFLFSLLKIIKNEEGNKKLVWYILWGLSLGISIQLHTLLFVSLPLISLLVFFYLLYNKSFKLIGIILAGLFFIAISWSQIIYDLKFQGANISGFFHGLKTQSGGASDFIRNIKLVSACQLEANAQIIFPLEKREGCEILDIAKNYAGNPSAKGEIKGPLYLAELILVLAFSLGGYFWLFKSLFDRKSSIESRLFLRLVALYNLIAFMVFIPVAGEIGVRYFLVLFFMPFIMLGLWLKQLFESRWSEKNKKIMTLSFIAILILANGYFIFNLAQKFKAGQASDDKLSVLSEIKPLADYIVRNTGSDETAILNGERTTMDRFDKALMYLVEKEGVKISKSNSAGEENGRYFWIGLAEKGNEKDLLKKIKDQKIIDSTHSGNIFLYLLKKTSD